MMYLLATLIIYLFSAVTYYAAKVPAYSHLKHTLSELGANGTEFEKAVGFKVFMPVGLGFILLAGLTYATNWPVAVLSGAMGFSYFLSAFFPCDPGTPTSGSWKNSVHNLVGGVAYVIMGYQLKQLIDFQIGWHAEVAFIALAVFLFNFIIGWPKQLVGLTQRLAEAAVFVCIFMLLANTSVE
jgi:hypothetical protein